MAIESADKALRFGLIEQTLDRLRSVFGRFPTVERVLIYGSRAKGNWKPSSDIDLVVFGPAVTDTDLLVMERMIDDLMLPYQVDLCRFEGIQNPDLVEHIQRVGRAFD